jgi:enediyne biosynthesis protein E3
MSSPGNVPVKMEMVQREFLNTEEEMGKDRHIDEILQLLDAKDPEFRSVAYESASMQIAIKDLSDERMLLNNWKEFRQRSANEHAFHIDIGLGWAFAKTTISPVHYVESLDPVINWMVFDGMGYYYALFKGRKTIKEQALPADIGDKEWFGFDQGLGRRCWYVVKGNVQELSRLIQSFNELRHRNLWRGVGIACGYVGGNTKEDLELLANVVGPFLKELRTGILLAAISRIASNTVTTGIKDACLVVCNKTLEEIKDFKNEVPDKVFYLYQTAG